MLHVTPRYFAKFLNVWITFHDGRALHVFFFYKYTKSDNLDWPDVNIGYLSIGGSLFDAGKHCSKLDLPPLLFPHPSPCACMM